MAMFTRSPRAATSGTASLTSIHRGRVLMATMPKPKPTVPWTLPARATKNIK